MIQSFSIFIDNNTVYNIGWEKERAERQSMRYIDSAEEKKGAQKYLLKRFRFLSHPLTIRSSVQVYFPFNCVIRSFLLCVSQLYFAFTLPLFL